MFRAFRHRNYRLYFTGQGLSLIGTWVQSVATSWLVFRLTESSFYLGLSGFASQIPTFALTVIAGVWIDRSNKHRLLFWTQALALVQAAALAILSLLGNINVWEIIFLNLILGCINALDIPIRQSFVVELVSHNREDLSNAIALNSSLVNGARLVGPTIAGLLIAGFGESVCFVLNAVSYIPVLLALKAMRFGKTELEPKKYQRGVAATLQDLREGLENAYRSVPIRAVLILLAVMSLTGMPYVTLLPIFASKILGGGAHTLGFLTSASGLGALFGALYLAWRQELSGLGRVVSFASIVFSASLIAFGASSQQALSLFIIFITGGAMMIQMAGINTILQNLVENRFRARVMSLYTLAFMGMVPIGSLIAGVIADRIGVAHTVELMGSLSLLSALIYSFYFSNMKITTTVNLPLNNTASSLVSNPSRMP